MRSATPAASTHVAQRGELLVVALEPGQGKADAGQAWLVNAVAELLATGGEVLW
jgi:hypothetical protein